LSFVSLSSGARVYQSRLDVSFSFPLFLGKTTFGALFPPPPFPFPLVRACGKKSGMRLLLAKSEFPCNGETPLFFPFLLPFPGVIGERIFLENNNVLCGSLFLFFFFPPFFQLGKKSCLWKKKNMGSIVSEPSRECFFPPSPSLFPPPFFPFRGMA